MGNASQFSKHRAGTVAMERATDPEPDVEAGTITPELPRDVKFDLTSVPIVTWSYDPVTEEIRWSAPIEDLFGVDPGTPGFVLNMTADVDELPAPLARIGEQAGDQTDAGSPGTVVDDLSSAILEPILTPIRAGVPPAEYDLRTVVTSPSGTVHKLIVRASSSATGGRVVSGYPAAGAGSYLGAVVDVTEHVYAERELHDMVDRFRLLTELSPDAIIVHRDGNLVYGNAAAVRLIHAESMEQYYGFPMTDFVHPDDVGPVAERLGQMGEEGQVSEHGEVRVVGLDGSISVVDVTSVRTSWGGQPAYQVIMRDMSMRIAAEAANRYRASLVAHVSDAIIGIDAEGRIESWNEAARAIYGWTETEVAGLSIAAVVTSNRTDSAAVLERGQRSHHRKDGSEVDVLVSIDPLIDDDTQPSGWVVVCTELTDARQAEAGRRAAEERYEAVVASLSEGIVLFDEHGNVSAHNEAAARILGDRLSSGSSHQIFTGSSIAIEANGHPMSVESFPHAVTLATGESQDDLVIGVTDGSGRRQWLSLSSRLLSGAGQSESPLVVCSFTDVTDRKAAEAQLHWLAYHDSLTGLGNRSLFNDELERELLVSMQRSTNLAVLFIDLDRFKLVNDSFGHASGDEVLLALAQRFKSAVRGGDVVSRFSGDEFVVLCRNVQNVDVAISLATEYSRLLSDPVQLSTGRNVVVTCSVGISFVMRGRQSAQDILQQADVAMFQAKNKGRSRVEVFDESLRAKSVARLEIYDDLRHSIDHDELTVHYQPIASVKDDRIVAMEALVRWNHPSRGLLGPMEFIPFAEETDLIFSLGRWVLREACQTMARWRRELPGAEDAYITVNLSAHQLSDTELLETIESALADSGLPPEALVMEVTESMLMSDTSESIAMLGGIHELGVGLAIDDFGTGYSSLAQLKRFPVKILKIDKSFVDGLGAFENDEAIVAAIVQLSKALGLVVLAEGVERPVQLQRVAELGCDLYQGYLMSRPTRADSVDFNKHVSYTDPDTEIVDVEASVSDSTGGAECHDADDHSASSQASERDTSPSAADG
jgi:diguanylate cyclase (GGDEF)-like protein/PAS domain S-box-containing protein